jgi:hypothetical protein
MPSEQLRSYLTETEWSAVFERFGLQETLAYANVCDTQLSIARHYGGATVNGRSFYYLPDTDELLRRDVFRWIERRRSDAVIAQRQAEEAALFFPRKP